MSETVAVTTELTSQYGARVAGDLEGNIKEQERLRGEIEALQAQLARLQQDHTVLVNIQQALGIPAAPPQLAPEAVAAVPAPRKKKAAASSAGKQTRAGKTATPSRKRTGKKTTAAAPSRQSAGAKLVDLVREHLAGEHEPRSAAEVATALERKHPEREIKAKIVRLTLEGLVAKNQAQRVKQGRSVFYAAPDTAEPAPQDEPTAQPSA